MADFLRANEAKLLDRWYEIVFAASRGRASAEEVRTELGDFYGLVVRAMSGADELAMGELRAALAALSRSRARSGFSPSETALAVFSLKDAVYEFVADAAEMVPEYLAVRPLDDLGLTTFETTPPPGKRSLSSRPRRCWSSPLR